MKFEKFECLMLFIFAKLLDKENEAKILRNKLNKSNEFIEKNNDLNDKSPKK